MSISFSGLSSGLDTDRIIQQLLAIERRPQERFANRQDEVERTQDAFKDLNNRLSNLQNRMDSLVDPSTFDQKQITNNKPGVLTASITNENQVQPGEFEIFVEQLATSAQTTSGQVINNQKMVDPDTNSTLVSDFEQVEGSGTLDLTGTSSTEEMLDQFSKEIQTSGDATPEFSINGEQFDLDSFDTVQGLIDDINNRVADINFQFDQARDKFIAVPTDQNSAGGTAISADDNETAISDPSKGFLQQIGFNKDETLQEFTQTQSDFGENLLSIDPSKSLQDNLFTSPLQTDAGEVEIRVNNTEIVLQETDTINDFISQVNDNVEGVNATFNSATDKIRLETEDAGAGSINVEDVRGNLGDALNLLTDGSESAGQAGGSVEGGTDAELTIDGDTVTADGNTNEFNGIQLDLLSLQQESENTGDPVIVEVSQDTQATADEVSNFVDQFNSVIDFINERTGASPPSEPGEEPDSDAGVFNSDSTVRQIKNTLTRIVTDRFADATGSDTIQDAASIGIEQKDPTLVSAQDQQKLNFDAGKFQEALENEPDAVENLFNASTDDGDAQDGLATRLEGFLGSATDETDGLITARIDGFDRTIANLQDRIERNEERVQRRREQLEAEFLQMEQILSNLQGQQSFISQRL